MLLSGGAGKTIGGPSALESARPFNWKNPLDNAGGARDDHCSQKAATSLLYGW